VGRRRAVGSKPLSSVAFTGAGAAVLLCGAVAAALTQFPFLIGDGMPRLTPGVSLVQGALIIAPGLALLFACVMAVCAVVAWARGVWSVPARIVYTAMTAGAVLVTGVFGLWRLIGF
jgi:hypothetical protein